MTSPLDPIWIGRVEPVSAPIPIRRRRDRRDEPDGGPFPDEAAEEGDEPDDDGAHVDVLA